MSRDPAPPGDGPLPQAPLPADEVVFVDGGQFFHPGDPPHVWEPGDAYDKLLLKLDSWRHRLGSELVAGLEGVQPVTGGYRLLLERGALYLKTVAGAVPVALSQSIDTTYDRLGNTSSFLGFPTDDVRSDPGDDGAVVANFENGFIFYWPDIGAVAVREVLIKFTGFHCFGETGEWSGSDEPYFINGVVPIITSTSVSSMTRIYDDVDAGMSVAEDMFMWQGPPQALLVAMTLYDHDQGDPNTYKALVDKALDKAADAATSALATLPAVGAPLAAVGQIAYGIAGPALKKEVNELLGTADDLIASTTLSYSAKDVLRVAGTAGAGGNPGRVETPLLSDGDASYKAYFDFIIVQ